MNMETELLLQRRTDQIFQITLNRPRLLNALSSQTIRELSNAIDGFLVSDDQVLILTGAGRAFCFGADFREFRDRDALPDLLKMFQDLILKIYDCKKVTIAVLNGFATGAGLDLALACDFRLAAEKIKLAEAYISMGLVPDGGGSYLLTSLIGVSRAMEMFLTAEPLTSEEALSVGLVNRVYAASDLLPLSIQFASQFVLKPQTAIHQTKRLLKNSAALKQALDRERESQLLCFQDSHHQSIVEEFLKKRG